MPKFIQVCGDEIIDVFEDKSLEYVKRDSQEQANAYEKEVTLYEVVAEMRFEPEEEEEEEEEDDAEEDDPDGALDKT